VPLPLYFLAKTLFQSFAIVETFAKIREFAKIVTELPDIKEKTKKPR